MLERDIVKHVNESKDMDLPNSTIDETKKHILDTIGAWLAGHRVEGSRQMQTFLDTRGGSETATLIGYNGRFSLPNAVMGNCMFARACETDDMDVFGGGHISASLIPAICNMSEDTDISGVDFIRAVAVSADFWSRFQRAQLFNKIDGDIVHQSNNTPLPSEATAPLGIAIAASIVRDYEEQQIEDALSIASCQIMGTLQGIRDGALTVRLQQGLTSKAGIVAADFARIGFQGPQRFAEGEYGIIRSHGHGEFSEEIFFDGLGDEFAIEKISFKPYPTCKQTHLSIHATLQLLKQNDITPQKVSTIENTVNSIAASTCGGDRKLQPETVVDAQFSLPYTIATTILSGREPRPGDFTKTAIMDPERLNLAQKVDVIEDTSLDKQASQVTPPNSVKIVMENGGEYEDTAKRAPGHRDNPLSWEQLIDKFLINGEFAGVSEEMLREIIDLIEDLESLSDAEYIIRTLDDATN